MSMSMEEVKLVADIIMLAKKSTTRPRDAIIPLTRALETIVSFISMSKKRKVELFDLIHKEMLEGVDRLEGIQKDLQGKTTEKLEASAMNDPDVREIAKHIGFKPKPDKDDPFAEFMKPDKETRTKIDAIVNGDPSTLKGQELEFNIAAKLLAVGDTYKVPIKNLVVAMCVVTSAIIASTDNPKEALKAFVDALKIKVDMDIDSRAEVQDLKKAGIDPATKGFFDLNPETAKKVKA